MSDSILQKVEYVYSGNLKWGLKCYTCSVKYYTEEPLPDLDYVICSIISTSDLGKFDKRTLGVMLGFSLVDNQPDAYYDKAEEELYENFLSIVKEDKLIIINDDMVEITNLGRISLETDTLYRFYNGRQDIYEHRDFTYPYPTAFLMFPFFEDMGIYTNLNQGSQFWPADSEVSEIIGRKADQLIKRIQFQSRKDSHIYEAVISDYYVIKTRNIKIKLFIDNGKYSPVVFKDGIDDIARKATDLFSYEENLQQRRKAILICLFNKLWDDENTVLNYENLEPYFELVDYAELTKDSRMQWDDDRLFDQIVLNADYDCWLNISNNCKLCVLYEKLDKYKNELCWEALTNRVEDQFLLEHFNDYPWDLGEISNDNSRSVSTIQNLILSAGKYLDDWDWYALGTRLEKTFVLSNLSLVNVELELYTEDTPEVRTCLLQNLDRKWSWIKIEKTFDLSFILDNILVFQSHFGFVDLFDRIFTDNLLSTTYISNRNFKVAIQENISNNGKLASALFNEKEYVWTDNVIDFFEIHNLIVWGSKNAKYSVGFECNNNLEWTYDFFEKYFNKVVTEIGRGHVSLNVKEEKVIDDFPYFEWDWTKLSNNPNISVNFIKSHLKLPWDWKVLTEKMFSELKYNNIGHRDFIDKWDWNYLSINLPKDFIQESIGKYAGYWDWNIIFDRLITIENKLDISWLTTLAKKINMIDDKTKKKKVWSYFSKRYLYGEFKELLKKTAKNKSVFHWDLEYFYELPEFNVFLELGDCYEFIDWSLLSKSEIVDTQLKYNPRSGITEDSWDDDVRGLIDKFEGRWEFEGLSTLKSLISKEWFLQRYATKLDWKYISSRSPIFIVEDKKQLIGVVNKFKSYISFEALSSRIDIDIAQIVKSFPNMAYDYNKLIANGKWAVTCEKIDEIDKRSKDILDWQVISASELFEPKADFLLRHIDKQWDWNKLTKKDLPKVWSSLDLLKKMINNVAILAAADWDTLTSRKYFPKDVNILSNLPKYSINWSAISSSDKIMSLLSPFVDNLDWEKVSRNPSFDVKDIANLERYSDYINWFDVCKRKDFEFTEAILNRFPDKIDWIRVSASETIDFTSSLVDKYNNYWSWPTLVRNKAYYNKIVIGGIDHKKQNIIRFIEGFRNYDREPKAYHFTHMSNAVKIIKSHLLQCRNSAEGTFENSAGTVINLREEAHNFVRFYFNYGSPTQFYNECLGKDKKLNYFEKARDLGLPKCPLPVFFVVDIEELLNKLPEKCYYSNGNMQKKGTQCIKIIDNPDKINIGGIYDRRNKDARQQEFLVKDELDLSTLSTLRIFCYDKFQRDLLIQSVGESPFNDKIYDQNHPDLYIRENRELKFDETDEILKIDTDYSDEFEFRIEYTENDPPTIFNTDSILRLKDNNIYMVGSVKIKRDKQFSIYFEVSFPNKREWLVYKNR